MLSLLKQLPVGTLLLVDTIIYLIFYITLNGADVFVAGDKLSQVTDVNYGLLLLLLTMRWHVIIFTLFYNKELS